MGLRLTQAATWISRGITLLEEVALAGGILGIAALTIGNVLTRTATGESLLYAEELCQFLIVLVTFLGLGYAAGEGRHIRMTAFYDQFSRHWQKGVMLLISSTTALLLFYLTWLALDYVFDTVRALGSVSPVLGVPRWLVYLAAPLGFFLAGVQYLLAFLKNLLAPEVYVSFHVTHQQSDVQPADVQPGEAS